MENNSTRAQTLCLSLQAIYEEFGPYLRYGSYIKKNSEAGNDYYWLTEAPPETGDFGKPLLYDGEECTLLNSDTESFVLCNVYNGKEDRFILSKQEFEVGIFVGTAGERHTAIVREKAKQFCYDVAVHYGFRITELAGKMIVGSKIYSSPVDILLDWKDTLMSEKSLDVTDIVEFICTEIGIPPEGITRNHGNGNEHEKWVAFGIINTDSVSDSRFFLGKYPNVKDPVEAQTVFKQFVSDQDLDPNKASDHAQITKHANYLANAVAKELNEPSDPRRDLIDQLRSAENLSWQNVMMLCEKAADIIESMIDLEDAEEVDA